MKKILVLFHQSIEDFGLLKDLSKDDRVILRCVNLKRLNKFELFVKRCHTNRISKNLKLPFMDFWFDAWNIDSLFRDIGHILIFDGALSYCPVNKLRKFQIGGGKISLFLINSFDASSPVMHEVKQRMPLFEFDNTFTFDEIDAEKYDFKLLQHCYYSEQDVHKEEIKYSAYFVGGIKGDRTEMILSTFRKLSASKQTMRPLFKIFTYDKNLHIDDEGIILLKTRTSYEEVLRDINKSNVVIELLQNNQCGASLRYYEAVVYNKKLLTTNHLITHYPYYNPKWMKIIKTAEDIDMEWVLEIEDVNYGYKGDFSPRNLIDKILNIDKLLQQ